MAEKATHKTTGRAAGRAAALSAMRYWVLQQGTEYYVVASEGEPDLTVPDGVRRKVIKGYTLDDGSAWEKAETLAAFYHGTVRR